MMEERQVELHMLGKCLPKDECRTWEHGPYLFISDESREYASVCENNTYYKCACIKCGAIDDYVIDVSEYGKIIYNENEGNLTTKFYQARELYNELLNNGLDEKEIVKQINEKLSVKNKDVITKKLTNNN